jgi:hypothetical protein
MAHIKYIIDVGADQIQHDDPAMNSSAVSWGGCYCQDCISKFRGYLSQKYTATELLALGITDMNGFSYKQYKLSGGNNSQLANDFDLFQKVSAVEYFNYIFQQTNAYAGKSVPFSSNNVGGVWSSPYDCFSFGIAELSESQLSVPELWLKYNAAVSFGKAQIFTLQSIDKEIYRRAIASSFGCGGHILAPWDVSISNPPPDRFFGIPSDYNDLYKFVRDHQQFFDGYEDAATFGPHMSDIRYDSNDAPMWISSGGKDVYLFARAKPNDVNAAVIIHVIDWSYLPTSFEIDLKKVRFYGATNNLSITLLRPNQNDLALSVSTSNGIASVVVPSVSPWGILVVGKY